MKLGFHLPHVGTAASPDAIVRVAKRAEELGYDSVWTLERVLYPVAPRSPYPATPDGSLPDPFKISYDPIETLTFVAAHTSRIRLGTSVIDMPYYNPVMLARRLTTLDILSNGRLHVGMGQGWSQDEIEATGGPPKGLAKRADEFIEVLKAIWTTDPVEYDGEFFKIAKSSILPKPVQKPHPPISLAAYSPGAMQRVAKYADAWNAAGVPAEGMQEMFAGIKGMAKQAGRDPGEIGLIVRANLYMSDEPMGDDRFIFAGSPDQVKDDIAKVRDMGAAEVLFDPTFGQNGSTVDGFSGEMEKIWELAH